MKIDLSKAAEGTTYTFSGSTEAPADIFCDRNLSCGAISVKGSYTVLDGFVGVKARLEFEVSGLCDNCLAPFSYSYAKTIAPTFAENPTDEDYPFDGESVDLSQPIAECLMLAVPAKLLCRTDCKGLCPACGARLSDGDCGCKSAPVLDSDNPFHKLKSLLGGAENGITEKKN